MSSLVHISKQIIAPSSAEKYWSTNIREIKSYRHTPLANNFGSS